MQHLLTVDSQCDETRPTCRKCEIYGISCDYSAVQVLSRRSTDPSSVQDVPNVNTSESSMLLMSLSDLGSRIDQALKLALSSDERSSTSRPGAHSKTLRTFHHFVTVMLENPSLPKTNREITRTDMVQLAFTVCIEVILESLPIHC